MIAGTDLFENLKEARLKRRAPMAAMSMWMPVIEEQE